MHKLLRLVAPSLCALLAVGCPALLPEPPARSALPAGGAAASAAATLPPAAPATAPPPEAGVDARRLGELMQALHARDDQLRELRGALEARDALLEQHTRALRSLGAVITETGVDGGDVPQLVARVGTTESELAALREEVRRLSAEVAPLRERAEKDVERLRSALGATEARLSELGAQMERDGRVLEALKAASPILNPGRDVPAMSGSVLLAERGPAGQVVLLSLGEVQGLAAGIDLNVRRADRLVAKVRVTEVSERIASGLVIFAVEGEAVREGDAVTTRG